MVSELDFVALVEAARPNPSAQARLALTPGVSSD
jgi:hypothetical protein